MFWGICHPRDRSSLLGWYWNVWPRRRSLWTCCPSQSENRSGVGTGLHRLRHAYRSRPRQAGLSPEIAARSMGHGPASVTLRYGQVEAEELVRAAERLSEVDEMGGLLKAVDEFMAAAERI